MGNKAFAAKGSIVPERRGPDRRFKLLKSGMEPMESLSLHRILVVDDDPHYRKLIQHFLEGAGYCYETAESAAEALDALRRGSFDLVVSDICMSGKDGLQLAREAKDEFPDLDFILMTGYSEKYSYSDIIEAGASDYITKPFSGFEFKAKLERIAREKGVLQRLREANSALLLEFLLNTSLAKLSNTVIGSTSLDEVSGMILEHAKELTGSQAGCIAHFADGVSTYPPDIAGLSESSRDREIILNRLGWLWERGIREGRAALNYSPRTGGSSQRPGTGICPFQRFVTAGFWGSLLSQKPKRITRNET